MADVDTILKAMRLVPDFDGNPHVLPRFIHLCDKLVENYLSSNPDDELAKLCLVNGILNKITGNASLILNSNGVPEDWDSIKSTLINNFSDQRDETALYNDLMLATQGNRSPQEFYGQCVNLYSTIMTYITLHEAIPTTIEAKRELYGKLAKQAFCRGLNEPLGSRVRCMRPENLQEALKFVQDELNVSYVQHCNKPISDKKHPPMAMSPSVAGAMSALKPLNFPVRTAPVTNWQPPQPMWRPSPQFNQPAQFNKPFNMQPNIPSRTQQMFRAPPPSYNPHQQHFQLPPRNVYQNQGPKPMSGVSHYVARERPFQSQLTGHDWRKSGNPPPSNYFKTREMNINECSNYDNYNYYQPEFYPFVEPVYQQAEIDMTNYRPDYYNGVDFYAVEPQSLPNNQYDPTSASEYQLAPTGPIEPKPSTSYVEDQDFSARQILDKSK